MQHSDSKHLPYSCRQWFTLVADIESYPAFLPGWSSARILQSDGSRLQVEQQLRLGPLDLRFHSTAQLENCTRILITSNDGPFRNMTIDWRFAPLPEDHCQVSVEITLALRAGLLKRPLEQALGHSSGQLLRLFEQRAHALYSVR
ncbi:MAG TPA: type II toxin-antitoxin system RatA family toxin [Gammaproteobacteria bacterium]|nr:type II toxin-antitoxin system RatA family toxin [Gammaproteobacteria bacterium]